jgi:CRISPR-associated endonuclease/helicase Cas3
MKTLFAPDFSAVQSCRHLDAACVTVWGLVVLSDWLASGQEAFRQIPESLSPEEYISASREAALRAVEAAKLADGARLPDGVFTDLWPELAAGLRPVQASCEVLTRGWSPENAPGLILIEAPMGEGKTEAALYLAARLMHVWGKSGFYMALPTAATSNSMYARLRDFLNGHGMGGLRLMHAQSWMVEDGLDGGEGEARTWLAPKKRAMLSQYAVGTVDQAMMGVLRVRSGVVRLLGLAGKVLILDEVHAYDAYMQGIIEYTCSRAFRRPT